MEPEKSSKKVNHSKPKLLFGKNSLTIFASRSARDGVVQNTA
jgi:hypothetical protein